jgi:hypothetical protein
MYTEVDFSGIPRKSEFVRNNFILPRNSTGFCDLNSAEYRRIWRKKDYEKFEKKYRYYIGINPEKVTLF